MFVKSEQLAALHQNFRFSKRRIHVQTPLRSAQRAAGTGPRPGGVLGFICSLQTRSWASGFTQPLAAQRSLKRVKNRTLSSATPVSYTHSLCGAPGQQEPRAGFGVSFCVPDSERSFAKWVSYNPSKKDQIDKMCPQSRAEPWDGSSAPQGSSSSRKTNNVCKIYRRVPVQVGK